MSEPLLEMSDVTRLVAWQGGVPATVLLCTRADRVLSSACAKHGRDSSSETQVQ